MAKGSIAKELLAKKIAEALGESWIGEVDKKYYVWSEENGEPIQIALTMTCPKNPIGTTSASKPVSADGFGYDFDDMPASNESTANQIEYTQEERDTINKLMTELGL